VVTVEDPIEYRLADITQVQVNERQGLTFAAVLRSVLRQDPDIVMVGEIRDEETAGIAVQASLTGHLVLSTLHTNDTIGAIRRLADMKVEPFKISNSLTGVTAQRLVRRVCPACAHQTPIDELPNAVRQAMHKIHGRVAHVRATGCKLCGYSGYKGRIPLIELLELGPGLREVIAAGVDDEQLRQRAVAEGALYSLEADALWHLLEGHTTLEEVQPYLEMEKVKQAEAAEPEPGEKPRILVAVGDPVWRAVLEGALATSPSEVCWVANGTDALISVARQPPALLVVAADLPGLTAPQVIRAVRTVIQSPGVGVIAVLAAPDDRTSASLVAAGADDVLAPPVDGEQVQARIQAIITRRHPWSTTAEVMKPPTPVRERERLAALRATGLLDTPPEERFDRITREAGERFAAPMVTLSLVDADRQWFKSRQGVAVRQTPRDVSFCGHAINYDDVFVVEDAYLDPRFSENPLVTGEPRVRFYAGAQIHSPDGQPIGTLCVQDHKPRALSEADRQALRELARRVEEEIAATPRK
jgi:CheY-like chemotaxis protein